MPAIETEDRGAVMDSMILCKFLRGVFVDFYTDELPTDDSMKFHHVAYRVDDWDAFRGKVDQLGYKLVLEGGGDALKFLYLDARDFLGHYIEYVWATPERWAQMGGK